MANVCLLSSLLIANRNLAPYRWKPKMVTFTCFRVQVPHQVLHSCYKLWQKPTSLNCCREETYGMKLWTHINTLSYRMLYDMFARGFYMMRITVSVRINHSKMYTLSYRMLYDMFAGMLYDMFARGLYMMRITVLRINHSKMYFRKCCYTMV